MNNNHQSHHALREALHDLKQLQHLLAHSWSKYYGHYFKKLVGSDTIPFCMTTKDCKRFTVVNPTLNLETSYFRIEAMDDVQITVTLLRAFDHNGHETNALKEIIRLEKTEAQMTIDFCLILAVQVLEPSLLSENYFVESKW